MTEEFGKFIFMDKDNEKQFKELPQSVKKSIESILFHNIQETRFKIEQEFRQKESRTSKFSPCEVNIETPNVNFYPEIESMTKTRKLLKDYLHRNENLQWELSGKQWDFLRIAIDDFFDVFPKRDSSKEIASYEEKNAS